MFRSRKLDHSNQQKFQAIKCYICPGFNRNKKAGDEPSPAFAMKSVMKLQSAAETRESLQAFADDFV